ncbi:hypothetical protein BDW69DRAFT_172218 [Aspergillus filifer]
MMVVETKDRSLEELDGMFQVKVQNHVCTGLGAEITEPERIEDKDKIDRVEWV